MEALTRILSIAVGGAFGAVARYLINVSVLQHFFKPFPLPTFVINVTGSFLIGFLLVVFTEKTALPENLRFAVLVGFLGAYTTFSTFELEIWDLIKENQLPTAFVYLLLSIVIGFAGVVVGVWLGRKL